MLADTIGTFGTSGAWALDANWGGSKPALNDVCLVRGNSVNITGSDESATVLTEVTFAHDFNGNTGTLGAPLNLTATNGNGLLRFHGRGASNFIDGSFNVVIVDTSRVTANALVLGSVGGNTNAITELLALRGRLTLGADAAVTTLAMGRQSTDNLIIEVATGAVVTSAQACGGRVENSGTVTTVDAHGVEWVQDTGSSSTTVNIFAGSRFIFNAGVGTNINLYPGGTLDFRMATTQRTCSTIKAFGGTILAPESPAFVATPTLRIFGNVPMNTNTL